MEYNELITQARQTSIEAPDTDTILDGMRHTLHRRQRQRQTLFSAVLILAVGTLLLFEHQPGKQLTAMTLAEQVSAHLDNPPTKQPAPLVGYRNSIYNHNIYTLR